MFCHNCGNRLEEGAAFCSSCGTKVQASIPKNCTACGMEVPEGAEFCIGCGQALNWAEPEEVKETKAAPSALSQEGTGLVGFSVRSHSPEILAAAENNRKSSIGFIWILVFLPLVGFPIAGLLMDDYPFGESVAVGIGISLVMLIINVFALKRTKQPMWEGVVTNKFQKEKYEHKDDSSVTYTEYTTVIITDKGKKRTIVEKNSRRPMYDYLHVGDRVRYHPKFGTYEKYDKSKDRIIYCNVCTKMNPINNDRCDRCNNLLFK